MDLLDRRQMMWKIPYDEVKNVADPIHYIDDFDTDEGYFSEENGTKQWEIRDGTLRTTADNDGTLTMMHVFEKNVSLSARFMYRDADIANHPEITR